ncbi:hypothetical protein B0I08_105146 [Glaciihabitans tibetensis]|uniref:Uncharacterized protein n=1 Tax=Glaciihabitans tibetensis TaxID=1266600 RepID=A0A2T0VCS5_9MICO|nr:DUF6049 family protein [Glaciihabitans tibetensis]PRY67982.1 hypothetical protein B0I08_105146 [Glaciihabitans tibetensis]
MTATPAGAVAALLFGLLGIGAALPATPIDAALSESAPSAVEEIDEGTVSMTVEPDTLVKPTAGTDVHLTVTIANRTTAAVDGITVDASVNRARLSSTSALSDWLTAAEGSIVAADRVGTATSTSIAAGDTRIVGMTVPEAALGFAEEGVYALGVRLLSDPAAGDSAAGGSASPDSDSADAELVDTELVAEARTALTWKTAATSPLGVAIAAPLVLPTDAPGLLDSATLAEYTARGGVLSVQLDAMLGSQVAIGIDPRVLASIRVLGSAAPTSAVEWLERLRTASNPTFPLAYADADITTPLAAGSAGVAPLSFDFAVDSSLFAAPDASESPSPEAGTPTTEPPLAPQPTTESLTQWNYTYPSFVWPTENSVTSQSLATIAAAAGPVLLSSDNVARQLTAATSKVTATVTPAAGVEGGANTPVVVADAQLSSLLQEAVNSENTAEWNSAMSELSAVAAVSSEEAGTAAPTVLATLDRTWFDNRYRLNETLQALFALPWAAAASVVPAFDVNTSGGPVPGFTSLAPAAATIVDAVADQSRIDKVAALLGAEAADAQFATIAADPLALTSARRLDLLAVLSNSWLDDPAAWNVTADAFLADSADIRNSVQIAPSSTVQLPADRGFLPVTVNNDLDQEVTVYVNVRARTPLLSVEEQFVQLVIEPRSSGRARVPVVSLANGEVQLTVTVLDQPGGNPIGQPTTVELNVHAGWETAGTIVFGVLVFGIFAAGIVRTVRKRRKATRTAE